MTLLTNIIIKMTKNELSFEIWANLMDKVYSHNNNGRIAIAFLLAAGFRDLILSKIKFFPLLFLYGDKASGKSQLAVSLFRFFSTNLSPFVLSFKNTSVIHQFRNEFYWLDEYNNEIEERDFQELKSAYDGVGLEKGKMTSDNITTTTSVNAVCVIGGQYLPTRDDNALFTRSILLSFEQQNFTQAQTEDYVSLKNYEVDASLINLVGYVKKHRESVDYNYEEIYNTLCDYLKTRKNLAGLSASDRLIKNYSAIIAPLVILESEGVKLPFDSMDLINLSVVQIQKQMNQMNLSE